jgi:hypothetical protein
LLCGEHEGSFCAGKRSSPGFFYEFVTVPGVAFAQFHRQLGTY